MRIQLVVFLAGVAMTGGVSAVTLATPHVQKPLATSADEVINRNVAARGGLEAWRQVNSLVWLGHVERAGHANQGSRVPFVMELERPNHTRFEIKEQENQFTRIFDGAHGWKVRPASNGVPEAKTFSKEEVEYAREEFAIDGPLIDYKAKGVVATLDGIDVLDGRKTYRLSLKLASGAQRKVWIDVQSNLEVRYDRPATNPLAPGTPISVYYADYKTVKGLKIAGSLVTSAAANKSVHDASDKLVLDNILVNPKLDGDAFVPPPTGVRHGGKVLIPADGSPPGVGRP